MFYSKLWIFSLMCIFKITFSFQRAIKEGSQIIDVNHTVLFFWINAKHIVECGNKGELERHENRTKRWEYIS